MLLASAACGDTFLKLHWTRFTCRFPTSWALKHLDGWSGSYISVYVWLHWNSMTNNFRANLESCVWFRYLPPPLTFDLLWLMPWLAMCFFPMSKCKLACAREWNYSNCILLIVCRPAMGQGRVVLLRTLNGPGLDQWYITYIGIHCMVILVMSL